MTPARVSNPCLESHEKKARQALIWWIAGSFGIVLLKSCIGPWRV